MLRKQEKNLFENLFFQEKPVRMITSLKREKIKYATQVAKHVDCTYSHTVKVLDIFKNMGLVTFNKVGRIKLIELTSKGNEVAHHFEGIRQKFNHLAQELQEFPTDRKVKRQKK